MNGLYASPGASQPITSQTVTLANPVVIDKATVFRHVVYVVVPVDALCERVFLAPGASLSVQFSPTPISIAHTNTSWNLTPWNYDNARVEVNLALPIRVHRIDSDGYGQAALHRMDGDKVIEEPTCSVATNKAITEEFVASRFAIALSGTVLKPNAVVQSAMMSASQVMSSGSAMSMQKSGQQTKAKKAGGNAEVVQQAQQEMQEILNILYGYTLESIVLQGQPTSPRLSLMNTDSTESLWQWLEFAGAQTETRSVTVTADQLQPAFERAFATRPAGAQSLLLPLVVESDSPCHVQIHAENFSFRRQANLLKGNQPVSLRFSSGQRDTQTLPLWAPDISAEALQLRLSLANEDDAIPTTPLPAAATLPKTGFRLQAGDHLATSVEMNTGAFLRGFTLPWWPLEAGAKHKLSLLADQNGAPASQAIVTVALLAESDVAQWLMFRWPEIQLQPGRYWLQLALEDGNGIWLASNGEGKVHRHCAQGAREMISVPQIPLHYALQDAGPQSAGSAVKAMLNGTPFTLQTEGDEYRAHLQPLPAKPWLLQLQMDRGGLVTLKEESLWY